jgi:hypothetical protein
VPALPSYFATPFSSEEVPDVKIDSEMNALTDRHGGGERY